MKNKLVCILAFCLLCMSALSACGSSSDPSYLVPTSSETKEAASSSEQPTSDTPSSQDSSEAPSSETPTSSESPMDFTAEDYSFGYTDEGYIDGVTALVEYVELPEFSKVNIYRSKLEPSDSTIAAYMSLFLQEYMEEDRESTVQDGDTLNIDYVGYIDGEAFSGGDTKGQGTSVTIGVTSYIDDFLEQLIGHKPGDTFDVNVTFPDPYTNNPDLAGKDAVFVTTINYISKAPEFNEEFITAHQEAVDQAFGSGVTSQEEAKKRVHDLYFENALSEAIENILNEPMDAFDAPDAAKEVARNQMNINTQLYYGMNLITFADTYGYTETQMDTMVENEAKALLIYQAIAEQNDWHYTEEDLKARYGDRYEDFKEVYGDGYLAQYMISENAMNYIKGSIKIVDDVEQDK